MPHLLSLSLLSRIWFFIVLLMGFVPIVTADMQSTYDDASSWADGQANSAGTVDSGIAADVVPNYTANPPQSNYYSDPGSMDGAAAQEKTTNEAYQTVEQGYLNGPKFNIDPATDPIITRSDEIAQNAEVLSGQYNACQTIVSGTPGVVEQKTCHEYGVTESFPCTKDLLVEVSIRETCTHQAWFNQTTVKSFYGGDNFYYATRAFCDLTRNDGFQEVGYYTMGESGGAGWQSATVPTTPVTNWTRLPDGRQCGGYGDNCYPVHVYYNGAGCNETTCTYNFIFGSYGSSWYPTYSCPSPSVWGELVNDPDTGQQVVQSPPRWGSRSTACYRQDCRQENGPDGWVTICTWVYSGEASPAGGFVGDTLTFPKPRYERYISREEWINNCAGFEDPIQ